MVIEHCLIVQQDIEFAKFDTPQINVDSTPFIYVCRPPSARPSFGTNNGENIQKNFK